MIKIATIIKTYRLIILSLLSSIFIFSSWPPSGFFPLIFVAFIPLLFIEEFFVENKHLYTSYRFFIYIFCSFLISNIVLTYWIANSSILAFIAAIVLNSFFMSIPWLIYHYANRNLSISIGPLALAFLWLGFEFLHLNWELSWPWLNLGNVFANTTSWIQWYEYTGTMGGSAWVLFVNSLGYVLIRSILEKKTDSRKILTLSMILVLMLITPIIISLNIKNNYLEEENPLEVVIVQPGHNPYHRPATMTENIERIKYLLSLAKTKVSSSTEVVVSPEESIPLRIWKHKAETHPAVIFIRDFSKRNNELAWIAGSFVYKMYDKNEKLSSTVRPYKNSNDYYDIYNSALLIQFDKDLQLYYKSKLVPGTERMPFYLYTKHIGWLIEMLGGNSKSFGFQEQRSVFSTMDSIKLAPIICYESVFGEYVSEYVRNGAQLLFIITNDGWWGKTSGYRQHFHYARLRAIETRRSIARAASTGMSGFIDQKGNVVKTLGWNESGAIVSKINTNNKVTYYTKHGDYIGRLSVFISLLIVLYIITQKIIRR